MVSGSRLGLIRVSLSIPLYLILTPLALNKLGTSLFAIWSFQTTVVALFSLSNLGLSNALIYHLAQKLHDEKEVNSYFNVAFFAFFFLGLFLTAIVFFGSRGFVSYVLNIPIDLYDEAVFVLLVTAIGLWMRFIASPYQALLEAHQEYAFVQAVSLLWLLVYFVGSVTVLLLFPGVYSLGIVMLLSYLLYPVLFIWRVSRVVLFIRIRLGHISLSHVRSMLRYGIGLQGASVAIALREPLLKILIARHFDLAAVAAFEVVYRICTQLVSFVMTPMLSLFSASALLAKQPEELKKILRPCLGFAVTLLFPAAVLLFTLGADLVRLWLGDKASYVVEILPLAFVAFAIYYLTEVMYKAIEASGWSYYSATVQIVSLGASIASFFIFKDDPVTAILSSLWVGFSIFSLSNFLIFKKRFPNMKLIGLSPMIAAFVLAATYIFLDQKIGSGPWQLIGYSVYLMVHLWMMQYLNVMNVIRLARRMMVEKFI